MAVITLQSRTLGEMQEAESKLPRIYYSKVEQNNQKALKRINFRVHATDTDQICLSSTASICIIIIYSSLPLNKLRT